MAKDKDKRKKFLSRKSRQSMEWQARNPARTLLTTTKTRARLKGLEWGLTDEYFYGRLAPMRCEVSGLPLIFDGRKHGPWRPSVDKIDPNKGYTPDNVQIVCWIYNRAKHIGPDEDVMILAKALTGRV